MQADCAQWSAQQTRERHATDVVLDEIASFLLTPASISKLPQDQLLRATAAKLFPDKATAANVRERMLAWRDAEKLDSGKAQAGLQLGLMADGSGAGLHVYMQDVSAAWTRKHRDVPNSTTDNTAPAAGEGSAAADTALIADAAQHPGCNAVHGHIALMGRLDTVPSWVAPDPDVDASGGCCGVSAPAVCGGSADEQSSKGAPPKGAETPQKENRRPGKAGSKGRVLAGKMRKGVDTSVMD